MHKKASNLFSEWALALRRSIGEPPPSSPAEVAAAAAAAAAACERTSPAPATTTPPPTPTRAATAALPAAATSLPPPPSSPAPALKKAASAASKSTGEQTKRQAETAEISRQMEADSFAAGAGTKGLLAAAAVAATAAAKKMSEGPKSPKYEPPDIHPELTLAQIQQQLSEQLSGQCPIAKHRKKHNSNNVNIHEDIDGGI